MTTQTKEETMQALAKWKANKEAQALIPKWVVPTQEQWMDFLITCWSKCKSLGLFTTITFNVNRNLKLSMDDWTELQELTSNLKPPIPTGTYMKMQLTSWIATHYPRTSNLLWDGHIEKARKALLIEKRTKQKPHSASEIRERDRLIYKNKSTYTIRVRELNSGSRKKITRN